MPPSGASPVFKLTLPHRIVHSYLSHLVETEFEIAPSANSTTCWQGTIAPRRNKDRSEYTLQARSRLLHAHFEQLLDHLFCKIEFARINQEIRLVGSQFDIHGVELA